jgi:predicted component of type VI protein secretion system
MDLFHILLLNNLDACRNRFFPFSDRLQDFAELEEDLEQSPLEIDLSVFLSKNEAILIEMGQSGTTDFGRKNST